MGGAFLPAEYGAMQPWWLNPFENAAAAQFNHRMLAYAVATATFAMWLAARRQRLALTLRRPLDLLLGMAAIQISLGVSTLLLVVPTALGVAHQGGAIAVFCLAVWSTQTLSRRA
jgi:cytochrome c oxidase assembly protein subunit 15